MNFNTQGLSTSTLSLTDFSMVTAKLAKVVIAFTGKQDKQSIHEAVAAKLKFLAAPVENSFRPVVANVAVGYIRANRPVRMFNEEKELRANYKVMSSNILMDNEDSTLWEIKQGASGRYLARHGNEDLTELVNASILHRQGIPKIHQLSLAKAAKFEFIAFAASSGDMDYGFCVASNDSKLKVVSFQTKEAIVMPYECVASMYRIGTPLSAHKKITAAGISREDKAQSVDYYKRLYGYSPEYLSDVINQIETDAVA